MQFQQFIGKTIKSIDESCIDCVKIEFTDGVVAKVYAQCKSFGYDIPHGQETIYFEVIVL